MSNNIHSLEKIKDDLEMVNTDKGAWVFMGKFKSGFTFFACTNCLTCKDMVRFLQPNARGREYLHCPRCGTQYVASHEWMNNPDFPNGDRDGT